MERGMSGLLLHRAQQLVVEGSRTGKKLGIPKNVKKI
jgi:hypothetical protein